MTVKKLTRVGDGVGIELERSTLERLGITEDTPLEVTTDGEALIVRPMTRAPLMDRALAAADRLMDAHAETYRKLAQ
jgi:antitoxin component of MazEF toxin-antitoxin module